MAGAISEQVRRSIDLVRALFEAAKVQQQPWGVSRTDIFDESLRDNLRTFPDLREKLAKFIEVKLADPLNAKYGKHDRPMTGPLVGFWHAHLRDDAILIYNLQNHCVNLVYIATHADIEGKRHARTVARLGPYKR